jgi:hypothetical protein
MWVASPLVTATAVTTGETMHRPFAFTPSRALDQRPRLPALWRAALGLALGAAIGCAPGPVQPEECCACLEAQAQRFPDMPQHQCLDAIVPAGDVNQCVADGYTQGTVEVPNESCVGRCVNACGSLAVAIDAGPTG